MKLTDNRRVERTITRIKIRSYSSVGEAIIDLSRRDELFFLRLTASHEDCLAIGAAAPQFRELVAAATATRDAFGAATNWAGEGQEEALARLTLALRAVVPSTEGD